MQYTSGVDLLLSALEISLNRRKLLLAALGLGVSSLVGGLFFMIGSLLGTGDVFFLLVGVILSWMISTLVVGAIAKMSLAELSGNPALGVGEALQYALSHAGGFLLSPILLTLLFLGVGIAEGLVLLLGRLPTVGPYLNALLFLPLVLVTLGMLVLGFSGGWLIPAIVAGEGTNPIETLQRLRTIVWHAPGRIFTFLSLTLIVMIMLSVVVTFLVFYATTFVQTISALLFTTSPSLGSPFGAPFTSNPLERLLFLLAGGSSLGYLSPPVLLIYAFSFLVLLITVIVIPYLIFPIAAACAVYLSLTQRSISPSPAVSTFAPPLLPANRPLQDALTPSMSVSPNIPSRSSVPAMPAYPPGDGAPAPQKGEPRSPVSNLPSGAAHPPDSEEATRFCRQCGNALRPHAVFCGQCGERL